MDKDNELKKEYLRSYTPAVSAARRLEEEIEQLREDKMAPALVMDDMPHAHDQKDLSDYAAKLDELERKLIKARYERIDLYAEIFADIERLEDETEKAVLTYRYLRRQSWEEICVKLGYQWAQVHRIHARALKHFNPMGGYYEILIKKMKDDTQ